MLLSGIKDADRKACLDIILRSSIRINEFMIELVKCQKTNGTSQLPNKATKLPVFLVATNGICFVSCFILPVLPL